MTPLFGLQAGYVTHLVVPAKRDGVQNGLYVYVVRISTAGCLLRKLLTAFRVYREQLSYTTLISVSPLKELESSDVVVFNAEVGAWPVNAAHMNNVCATVGTCAISRY